MIVGRKTAFCTGCEFAGSIPSGTPLNRTSIATRGDVKGIVYMDGQMRLSKKIVHANDVESAPATNAVTDLIADCQGQCKLEANGFVPLDVNMATKRTIVTKHLNSLAGIQELGSVSFDTQPQE